MLATARWGRYPRSNGGQSDTRNPEDPPICYVELGFICCRYHVSVHSIGTAEQKCSRTGDDELEALVIQVLESLVRLCREYRWRENSIT
jgi:hypothetical protein